MFHTEDPQILCPPWYKIQLPRWLRFVQPFIHTQACTQVHTFTHTQNNVCGVLHSCSVFEICQVQILAWRSAILPQIFSFPQFFQQNTRTYLILEHNHFLSHISIIILPFVITCSNIITPSFNRANTNAKNTSTKKLCNITNNTFAYSYWSVSLQSSQ